MDLDEDKYQFVPTEDPFFTPTPKAKAKTERSLNPSTPYNLWKDLSGAMARISFAQLVQIAPTLRKQMKEGTTIKRLPKVVQVNKVEQIPNLKESKETFEAVEIEVEIVDKFIKGVLVDDGSSVNIMHASTMEKLGLKVIQSSHLTLTCANQRLVRILGRIKDLRMQTSGVDYFVTFEVIRLRPTLY